MEKRSFASDNNSGVHENILKALKEANKNDYIAYGDDPITKKAIRNFKNIFGDDIDIYFVMTGTGANVLGLKTILRSYNSVIATDFSHINVDEVGAVENNIGCKINLVPTEDGKLDIEKAKNLLHVKGVQHHSQPKAISISQTTEMGTVYSVNEIKEIAEFAHDNDMYLHMDGARISNAAVSLEKTFKEFTKDAGVDILSFGGTKNGMLMGEAVVFMNKSLGQDFKYLRKEGLNLYSKMRYLSAQFNEFFKNDLWYKNAAHANNMSQYLKKKVDNFDEVEITQNVDANAIFSRIPKDKIEKLQKEHFFYIWDNKKGIVRWMTSFQTKKKDIDRFIEILEKYLE